MRTTYLLCWLGITTGLGAQPLVLEDSLKLDQFEEIVVTASRLEQKVSSVSLPLVVVKAAELQRMGSLRLDQVLREQTGLVVVNDHGLGLQMQGLKPEYTLILLNGEPLIGRTAGTLDLSRLSVGNVERIEILKGPSSSLYGSEALGGVVNIITQTPKQHRLQASARYGSNRSSDFALQGHYHRERFQAQVFLNRYASGGYDLSPQVFGQTVEPFASYTAQTQLHYQATKDLAAKMQFRYAASEQALRAEVLSAQGGEKIGGRSLVRDLQANPWLDWQIHPRFRAQLRGYYSFYHTQEVLYRLQGGGVFDSSFFHQQFLRPEFQGHYRQGERHNWSFGTGYIREQVQASRYEGNKQFWTAYAFAQYQWTGRRADFSLGLRADHQSVYGSQISPKASGQYQILANKLWLKASVGRGFKAPDFRQLYLNFNNSLAGYMVLGTEELPAALTELQHQGQIAALLLSPDQTGELQAESSWGYNLGLWYAPNARWSGSLNLFRNDVNNLIETQLVARKTNGQSIFSYRNLQRIYTQGLETDWNYQHRGWSLGLGYQALWAKDKAQVEAIAKGEVYRTDPQTFITTRVKSQDYFGLFGRSRHHLNLKAGYRQEKQQWDVYLRGIYRGPYGLGDRNGNLILDEASEFVEGFWLLNLSASKSLWQERVLLQAGVDNLLNHRDALNQPEFAGRLYWISLHFFLKP